MLERTVLWRCFANAANRDNGTLVVEMRYGIGYTVEMRLVTGGGCK